MSRFPLSACRTWPFPLIHLDVIARFMETPLLETETASPDAGLNVVRRRRRRRRRRKRKRERQKGRNDQKTMYFACEKAEARAWVHAEERKEGRMKARGSVVRGEREKKRVIAWIERRAKREEDTSGRKQGQQRGDAGKEDSSWRP